MTGALRAWGPAAVWAAVLFSLSELSGVPRGPDIPHLDKLVHFLLYGILGAALAWGRWRSGPAPPHWLLLTLGGMYGALDEWHQARVPGRTPSGADLVTDVLGCVAGYAALLFLLTRGGVSSSGSPTRERASNPDRR